MNVIYEIMSIPVQHRHGNLFFSSESQMSWKDVAQPIIHVHVYNCDRICENQASGIIINFEI